MSILFPAARLALIYLALVGVLTGCARAGQPAGPVDSADPVPAPELSSSYSSASPSDTANRYTPVPLTGGAAGKNLFARVPGQLHRPQETQTAVPAVTGLDPSCLTGEWQVADPDLAAAQTFEHTQSNFRLDKIDGQTLYTFSGDGTMEIRFRQLSATLSGTVDDLPVTVNQTVDGSATARYQVDSEGEQIVLTDFGGEGIYFTLSINGQTLASGDFPVWRALASSLSGGSEVHPTPLVKYSRAAASCAGDRMTIQAVDPLQGPEVQLKRVP
ncbi:MAG: hypothetical protein GX491_13990 [Chloroflexi bacterium]|nr:hypothetical protein [Chloroflexota bacterium]